MSKVFDSNILIYHLNGRLNALGISMLEQGLQENAAISIITRIEILGWSGQSGEALLLARNLLDRFVEQPLTDEVADLCIELRQQRRLKIPDAIIGATALHMNLPLVTRNTDDFRGVEGLELINPFDPREI